MRMVQLPLAGMLVLALLGLASAAAATEEKVDEWWLKDPVWQELDKDEREYKQELERVKAKQAEVRVRIADLNSGWNSWWWARWRQTDEWWRARTAANDELIELQVQQESWEDKLEAVNRAKLKAEADTERERLIKGETLKLDEGTLPVPGWGDLKVKQGNGVGYKIWCVSFGKDTPYEKANGWLSPRWAESAAQFKTQLEYCQPPNPRPKDTSYAIVIRTFTKTSTGSWEVDEATTDVKRQVDDAGNFSASTEKLHASAARKN